MKKEKEIKRLEAIKRKQENKELAEKEMNEIIKSKFFFYNFFDFIFLKIQFQNLLDKVSEKKAPTRGEIEEYKLKVVEKYMEKAKLDDNIIQPINIDLNQEFVNENYGKLENKTSQGVEIVDVSGVNEALEQLTFSEFDKHPEKRMRAVIKYILKFI